MSQQFNPYHVWLGIPLEQQPANYYRLLGIEMFEDDPDVITSAADKQMAHLRTFQAGKHGTLTQRLLNEVSAARICLLDPEQKAEYDSALRSQSETGLAAVIGVVPSRSSALKPKKKQTWHIVSVVSGAAVVLVLVIAYLVAGRTTQQIAYQTPKPAIKIVEPPKIIEAPKPESKPELRPEQKPEPPKPELKPEPRSEPAKPDPEPVKPEPKVEPPKPEQPHERKKMEVPSEAEQKQAKKLVMETFQEELSGTDTKAVAKKLMSQANETKDDHAAQYVLLEMARDIAVKAQDGTTAFDAIDKMTDAFGTDRHAMKCHVLSGFAKTARTVVAHRVVAEKALAVLDEAINDNNFEAATELGKLAFVQAGKCRAKDLSAAGTEPCEEPGACQERVCRGRAGDQHVEGKAQRPQCQHGSGQIHLFRERRLGHGFADVGEGQ